MKNILLPTGDPAGIGPDISLMLPSRLRRQVVLLGDGDMLHHRAKLLGLQVNLQEVKTTEAIKSNAKTFPPTAAIQSLNSHKSLRFINLSLVKQVIPGQPDIANNPYILKMLHQAIELCHNNKFAALVTAPFSKEIINYSIPFIGLTEFLQQNCLGSKNDNRLKPSADSNTYKDTLVGNQAIKLSKDLLRLFCGRVKMELSSPAPTPNFREIKRAKIGKRLSADKVKENTGTQKFVKELRVAFASMHIPLNEVIKSLSRQKVEQTIRATNQILQKYFGEELNVKHNKRYLIQKGLGKSSTMNTSNSPSIALCALNPHAGENGLLGNEEVKWLKPLTQKLKDEGINISSPLAADSLFAPINMANYDAIIALYHDQGLTPFKALTFGKGAQITFGLPFLRLSPDHGTVFPLAGTGSAQGGSMEYAVNLALRLSKD